MARGIASNLLGGQKRGSGVTEVPQWGQGSEPRWGSGDKAPRSQRHMLNIAIDSHKSCTVQCDYTLKKFPATTGRGGGRDMHPCPPLATPLVVATCIPVTISALYTVGYKKPCMVFLQCLSQIWTDVNNSFTVAF